MHRYLNSDDTIRSTAELVAVILEYEHALSHVAEDHDGACSSCQRLAESALNGDGEPDFLDQAVRTVIDASWYE
jgi:hypothetical protein